MSLLRVVNNMTIVRMTGGNDRNQSSGYGGQRRDYGDDRRSGGYGSSNRY